MRTSLIVHDDSQIIYYITDFEQEKRLYLHDVSNFREKAFYNKKSTAPLKFL